MSEVVILHSSYLPPQRRSNFSHNLLIKTTFFIFLRVLNWFWGHMKKWVGNIRERLLGEFNICSSNFLTWVNLPMET